MECERTHLERKELACACHIRGTTRKQVQSLLWLISVTHWQRAFQVGSFFERTHGHRPDNHKLDLLITNVTFRFVLADFV